MFKDRNEGDASLHSVTAGSLRNGSGTIVTLLLCENSLLRTGLKHILSGTCFNVTDVSGSIPDLYLVDASDPSERLLETVRSVKSQHPLVRVVLIGNQFDRSFLLSGVSAGVDGFCLAASDREVLVKSLELIMLGENILPGTLVQSLLNQAAASSQQGLSSAASAQNLPDPRVHKLSPREKVILQSLMGGDANKVIARKLDITEATIKVHVKAILRKIGAANRTQAAMWATGNLNEIRSSAAPEGRRLI
jgi:two-component system nitrate/nitrite response regulator NarL